MFSWLSGVARGRVIKRCEFESCEGPVTSLFFRAGHYESDVLFFFLWRSSKVLTFNLTIAASIAFIPHQVYEMYQLFVTGFQTKAVTIATPAYCLFF